MAEIVEFGIMHPEGSYEEVAKRLAGVESGLALLRWEVESSELRQQTRELFHWVLAVQVLSWLTTMGLLLAFLFRR